MDVEDFREERERNFKELLSNNVWEYDQDNKIITHLIEGRVPYEIPFDQMTDSAAVLDWIAQVAEKTWATPRIVGDMVLLLDAVLGLRSLNESK